MIEHGPGSDPSQVPTQYEPPPELPTIGPYRLLQKVGDGGMGEVWLAEQLRPVHRRVALKVIKAGMETAQVVTRFEVERQALALMDHPCIAKVFDAGATPSGRPYFAMEYVRGEPINLFASRHHLTIEQRLQLLMQVCSGVHHAHQKGIIHRDLKPSNVLVTLHDDAAVPKIIDFGVAKATTPLFADSPLRTEWGAMVGTPEYMSPEQAELGSVDVDTRTDVYALGVILYELLTDALPFGGGSLREGTVDELRRRIREVDPLRPSARLAQSAGGSGDFSTRISHVRGDLDWITMKALEKDRARRYGSVAEFAADLQRHLDHRPVMASPPSSVYRMRKFMRRHRLPVAAAATIFALLVVFIAALAIQAQRIARERDRANAEAVRANSEAASANYVTDFLVGLFRVADPSEARGNTLTAREILDKGAKAIEFDLRGTPEVQARLLMTIGSVYTGLGDYSAAESMLQRARGTYGQINGLAEAQSLAATSALADLYWYQERFAEAERLYAEVIVGRRRLFGDRDRLTLRSEFDLASTYGRMDRTAEAEPLYRSVLERQRQTIGERHRDTVQTIGNLSNLYWRLGRYAEALPLAVQALDLQLAVSGPDHPATLEAMHNLATTYDRLDRIEDAFRLYRRAIDTKRHVQGAAHPSTVWTQLRFAQMLQRLGRFSDAESQLSEAHAALAAQGVAANRQRQQQVAQQFVSLYEQSQQPHKARQWRNRAAPSQAH